MDYLKKSYLSRPQAKRTILSDYSLHMNDLPCIS